MNLRENKKYIYTSSLCFITAGWFKLTGLDEIFHSQFLHIAGLFSTGIKMGNE